MPVMVRPQGTFVWHKGSVLNLSSGGMMLHTAAALVMRQTVELEVSTTDKDGKKTLRKYKATIAWKKNQLYGVKFNSKLS